MASVPPPTIIDLKYAFLRNQIQALSQPVAVPLSFRNARDVPDEGTIQLRQKSIDEAMYRLNGMIKQHSKEVYSRLAQRHVAEQIDSLYWQAGNRDAEVEEPGAKNVLEHGADFTADSTIERLPETWPDADELDKDTREEYTASVAQLRDLDERRRALRERVKQYKALKDALRPFENPKENVQENLCVKNGELEGELDRMRTLIARVQGRIGGLEVPPQNVDSEGDVLMTDEKDKLAELLALD